ncbi:hypothetical protein ACFV0F_40575, partial [Streptomyces bottropensis]
MWDDEVRDPSSLVPDPVEVSGEQVEEAMRLIEGMTLEALEGPQLTDRYTKAVGQVIEAKREDRRLPSVPEPETPGQVVDLMTALEQSVAKAKASRGEGEASLHEMPAVKNAAKGAVTLAGRWDDLRVDRAGGLFVGPCRCRTRGTGGAHPPGTHHRPSGAHPLGGRCAPVRPAAREWCASGAVSAHHGIGCATSGPLSGRPPGHGAVGAPAA